MTQGAIEPTAVYPPPRPVQTGQQKFYQTYNTRNLGGGTGGNPYQPPGFNYSNSRTYNMFQRVPGGNAPVTVPKGVPRFLGNRSVIMLAWLAAMAMVSLDEWHTHGVLPRPARLWYTTLTYALIAATSTLDVLVPVCSALAVGLTIAVAYQYYTGTGSFGNYGARESGSQQASATTGGTAGGGSPAPKAA